MSQILGVKFNDFGQIYYFSSGPFVVREGHCVIVKTEQGMGLGKVFVVQQDLPEDISEDSIKTIYRLAGDEDIESDVENRDLSKTAYRFCKNCIDRQKLEMKLVDVEVFFDRSKMIFYFTAPGRIDFRELVKDLVKEYRTRIELRQIGVRHETQMLGAIGNCGQICCCRRFMRKFMPVTIRMAKEQNLFLNPTKISGICGRLLCCLSFEQENYEQFHKKSPKIGKRYNTDHGSVRVTRSNFFRGTVTVMPEQGDEIEIDIDEWPDLIKSSSQARGVEPRAKEMRENEARSHEPLQKAQRKDNMVSDLEESVPGEGDVKESDQERPQADGPKKDRSRPERRKRAFKPKDRQKPRSGNESADSDKPSERKDKGEQEGKTSKKTGKTRRPSRRRRKKKPSGSRKN